MSDTDALEAARDELVPQLNDIASRAMSLSARLLQDSRTIAQVKAARALLSQSDGRGGNMERASPQVTLSDEVVEAVARALFDYQRRPRQPKWDKQIPEFHHHMRMEARAAITAYQKATAGEPRHEVNHPDLWRSMESKQIEVIVTQIMRDVGELPDRTSPDDQPSMMMVTTDELEAIVRDALAPPGAGNG